MLWEFANHSTVSRGPPANGSVTAESSLDKTLCVTRSFLLARLPLGSQTFDDWCRCVSLLSAPFLAELQSASNLPRVGAYPDGISEDVLVRRGKHLMSVAEQIDTKPMGRAVLTILSAIAQSEREQIAKRVHEVL